MEISLEKIELIKDRTGVSYKEAKDALEAAEGSVVDAIIAIEESIDESSAKSFGKQGAKIIDEVKNLVKKGNVSKIVVKKDGEVKLNIPVNVGIIGTVIAPFGMIAAVAASFGYKCCIEVVKEDGTIIDVSDRAEAAIDGAKEKSVTLLDEVKTKSAGAIETAKNKVAEVDLAEIKEDIKEKLTPSRKDDEEAEEEFDFEINIAEDIENAADILEEDSESDDIRIVDITE